MNNSLLSIGSDPNLPILLLLFNIFKHICTTNFYDDLNPPLNTVQLMVSKLLMFHENIELLPLADCYELSTGNNESTKHITLVLVRISIINKLEWVLVAKWDL